MGLSKARVTVVHYLLDSLEELSLIYRFLLTKGHCCLLTFYVSLNQSGTALQ